MAVMVKQSAVPNDTANWTIIKKLKERLMDTLKDHTRNKNEYIVAIASKQN
jgi:hypothetical protein